MIRSITLTLSILVFLLLAGPALAQIGASGACCGGNGDPALCVELSNFDCPFTGGTYAGDGTTCLGDSDGDGYDDQCGSPPQPTPCSSGDDCHPTQYCPQPLGECGVEGVCAPRPLVCGICIGPECPPPVCGCDGNTYNDECSANRSGTTVASEGECPPPPPVPTSSQWSLALLGAGLLSVLALAFTLRRRFSTA